MFNQANQNSIPQKLVALREYHKLALPVFAGALNMNPGLVEKWERGFVQPEHEALRRIADYYKIDVGYFYGPFVPVRTLYSGGDPSFYGAGKAEKRGKTKYSFGPSVASGPSPQHGVPPQHGAPPPQRGAQQPPPPRPQQGPPPQHFNAPPQHGHPPQHGAHHPPQHASNMPAIRAPAPQQQQYSYSYSSTYNVPAPMPHYAPSPHMGGYMPPPAGSYRSITIERTFQLDKWIMAGHLLVLIVPLLCMLLHFFAYRLPGVEGTVLSYRGFNLLSQPEVDQGRILLLRIGLWAFVIITALMFLFAVLRLITADGRSSPFDLPIKVLNYLFIFDFIVMIVAMILFREMAIYGFWVFMLMFLIALMYTPVSMGGWQAFSLGSGDGD